jgi:SpoVK/Ycf46/Vps4 family AAA+-type ATPase
LGQAKRGRDMARMKVPLDTQEHQLELARKHKRRVNEKLDHDLDLCSTTEMIALVKSRRRTHEALVINGLQYLTPKDLARVVLLVGILSLWRSYPKWG